jgi:hypothetical protein
MSGSSKSAEEGPAGGEVDFMISSCFISLITLTRSRFPPSPTESVLFKDPPPVIILVSPAAPTIRSGLERGETGPKLIYSIGI